jgi:hypothetical protein
MVDPLIVFKPDSIPSIFDSNLYAVALHDFTQQLPGGKSEYLQSIACAYDWKETVSRIDSRALSYYQ